MASLLNQTLGDDRYQKCGQGGCKRQPRHSGREHEDLVGAGPNYLAAATATAQALSRTGRL